MIDEEHNPGENITNYTIGQKYLPMYSANIIPILLYSIWLFNADIV